MTRSVLAHLTGLSSDRTVLDTAIAAARIGGGTVLALRTRIDIIGAAAALAVGLPNPTLNIQDSIADIRKEEAARAQHAREAYDEALNRHDITNESLVRLIWEETRSLSSTSLARARYHDLTVMGREQELSAEQIRTVLMASGRPLILAPPRPPSELGKIVAVAWKEGADAARALTAAEPLLAGAQHVFILAAVERGQNREEVAKSANHLAAYFAAKGIKAGVRLSETDIGSHAIRDLAYECDADLLVMGAYGHSRVREMLLGGMTEAMLADCAIPVFLFH